MTHEHFGTARTAKLARVLLPSAADREPGAVLSALGYRALGKFVRTIDDGEEQAQLVHEWERRHGPSTDEDHYGEMEARQVGVFKGEEAPPEWETTVAAEEPAAE